MATPATVQLSETNGTSVNSGPDYGGTTTDGITNINFGSADSPNLIPGSAPIIIGNYSFIKWLRVHVSSLGTSTTITNLRLYKSAGTFVTGALINFNGYTSSGGRSQAYIASYAHACSSQGAGYLAMPSKVPADIGKVTNAFSQIPTSTPSTENISIANSYGGTITSPGYSDFFCLALQTTGSSPTGLMSTNSGSVIVITLLYDET